MGQGDRFSKTVGVQAQRNNVLKRKKRRRRFCPGEQAPGWTLHAARRDFRSCLHARLSARSQPVRYAPQRGGQQTSQGRSSNFLACAQAESKAGNSGCGAFPKKFRLGFLSFRRTKNDRRPSAATEEDSR